MKKPEPFVFEGQTYYKETGSNKFASGGICSDCAFDKRGDCFYIPCGPHHYITAVDAVTKRLNPPLRPSLFGNKPQIEIYDDLVDATKYAIHQLYPTPLKKDPAP